MFFKPKDLMTVGNVVFGVLAALEAVEGVAVSPEQAQNHLLWSGLLLLCALAFDMSDGVVARALKQMNRFGAEFDNVADLTSYSVAPSFIVYLAYRKVAPLSGLPWDSWTRIALAACLALVPVVFGCIRFARFNVHKLDLRGFWIGFPRPASAVLVTAMVNSDLFVKTNIMGWLGAAIIVVAGVMNVSLVPYIGHHGRRWSWHLKIILNMVWISVVLSLVCSHVLGIMPERVAFDVVFMWLGFYLTVQWADIPSATRARVAKLTEGWK